MHPNGVILPLLLPMVGGIVALLLHGRATAQRAVGVVILLANLAVVLWALRTVYEGPDVPGRVLVSQMGNWPAPFGISLVIDPLAGMMLLGSAVVCLAVLAFTISGRTDGEPGGFFHPLLHFLLLGVNWSFVTGDLFNLFVAFEIMLMASYGLFVDASGTRDGGTRQLRTAYKYVLLNLFTSTLFVTACGLIYGRLGTLNMAEIARLSMAGALPTGTASAVAVLALVFASKAAAFPLWYWLPDAYPALPPAMGALFGGLLTKVGAYTLLRLMGTMFGTDPDVVASLTPPILIAAGVTMFLGVLGAVSSTTIRRILSIHIISQVGYMVLGIGLMTELAVAGTILFVVHNMVVKSALFLCCGVIERQTGTDDLSRLGGLLTRGASAAWLGALFLTAAMSLVGLPPLSGFYGKFLLIRESLNYTANPTAGYWLAFFATATGSLTLLSMLKIWGYTFWSPVKAPVEAATDGSRPVSLRGPLWATAMLVAVALSIGLGAQTYFDVARVAARGVIDPRGYVSAVLGPYPQLATGH